MVCKKHRKYKAKKKPTGTCETCWKAYIHSKTRNVRKPTHRGTIAFRDVSKYTRKRKHPKKGWD